MVQSGGVTQTVLGGVVNMNFRYILIAILLIPSLSYSQDCMTNIDGKYRRIKLLTSSLAMMKTFKLSIDLKRPKSDAVTRLKHGDFRLLTVRLSPKQGKYPLPNGVTVPSLMLECQLGERFIEGMAYPIESEAWAEWSDRYYEYAIKYNQTVLIEWKKYTEGK